MRGFSKQARDAYRETHGMEPEEAAGLRYLSVVDGKHLVGIYNGDEAGLAGAWSTVCEEHGFVIQHETFRLARWHAPDVESWCEVCSGSWVPEEES